MAMEAASPDLAAKGMGSAYPPEQSLVVASLLSMSGGFLDAFTWLSLGTVFANSQTGNLVFLGMNAALGRWHQAAHHIPRIVAFLAGAWVATRIRAPLLCLVGGVVSLATAMLLLHGFPEPLATVKIALQMASFRQLERWNYFSVVVTGNMLRAVEQLTSMTDPEAWHGAKIMLAVCLMFVLGTAAGGFVTVSLSASSLIVPIGLSMSALWLCCRYRYRRYQT
jgi:uncharacterized membrane protein YoaK (UPF0700 family)